MKALFLEENRLIIKAFPKPSPPKNEALIKVLKAGIGDTDLEFV